ncbi:MAG: undecaprenyldiphospho-muramoylpentapeptide beta-N-acetylglucosaminyltransferase [Oscillospiraceae bacterium]|jgi:UDP-N-acetylglucosamine--N-acetylmuramyl-(pentapeptide) pyrophosphoryl-undecaprenol N-acetylglucosamine transferase|nr:undecaprenyldiphospho-muramoylpentapeptide beta-N-acetylglucosaminyltransferase [Oscillospiraceae bacterium]
MRVLLVGGGTAGHINPAIAIGNFIRKSEKNAQILYIGAVGGMEEKLVTKAGFKLKTITISGFDRKVSLEAVKKNFLTLKRLITSIAESKKIIKDFSPDICIGTGGYVSGPVLKAAQTMGIKTIIHEQNALPGVTTRLLSKKVDCVMIATEIARKYLNGSDIRVTGNPIREDILSYDKESAKKLLNFDERPVILSFGGSLGSIKINSAVAGLIAHTVSKGAKYQHIHAYGHCNGEEFLELLKNKGVDLKKHKNLIIEKYVDMPKCLAAADLIISRSGAITISELQAAGKASILIPSPNVAENHQYHNAMQLAYKKAAKVIEEEHLTNRVLIDTVEDMFENRDALNIFSKNAKKMAIPDSDKKIYDIIKEVVKKTNSTGASKVGHC